MTFITEIEKSTLKFFRSQGNKKSNAGGITIPNFKLYYRPIAIKIAWYWHKNRYEGPDTNPHSYTYRIFDKGTKDIQWRKDSFFNKCCWEQWISACRKRKLRSMSLI
jgi:hypothetical protein